MHLYLERGTDDVLVDGIRRGLNILLQGGRGSGKTTCLSRLLWLARHDEPRDQRPGHAPDHDPDQRPDKDLILIRARGANSLADLLYLVITSLRDRRELPAPPDALADPPAEATPHPSWPELASTQSSLARLREDLTRRPRPVVFLVDDVDPVLGHKLFGVLRDDLWMLPAQWVVTASDDAAPTLLEPPADAFFDVIVRLEPLTPLEASRLLQRRTGLRLEVPERSWQPRDVLKLAATTDPRHWESQTAARAHQRSQIAALGRPASMLADTLRTMGPVSSSDPRVLEETGWTRSRVSQVLRQLLDAGHVTFTETPNGRPGRPTRLYRLLGPAAS